MSPARAPARSADGYQRRPRIISGPINTIDKVFADPQVQHLGIAKPVEHPKYGAQKVVGQPIHLSRYPQPEKLGHTPEPGEHTDAILKDLGYDSAAITALRGKGAV